MNIGQIARNQQMMYRLISRSTGSGYSAQMGAQLTSMNNSSQSDASGLAGLMQSMGGMQGRTVREMAQYQMRVQNAQKAASTQSASAAQQTAASAATPQFAVRQQYAPISDEATEAMQKLALEDAKNSVDSPSADSAGRAKLIREHLQNVDPSQRTASFNTMNKVWESEMDRIGKFIQEKEPGWNDWGDKFDAKILDDYKAGVNVWV